LLLNPAAFSNVPLNPDGTPTRQGDLPRNFIHGPGFWNLNMAVQRKFEFTDKLRLILDVEAFNVLNHANPGGLNACLCSGPSFGLFGGTTTIGAGNQLYATGGARSIQIALKLQF
jgi:hypothetical protein